jgi:Ca-activated chloride channel homolog
VFQPEMIHAAILIDTSSSMRMKAPDVQDAALSMIKAFRLQDPLMLASFDSRIFVDAEFGTDRDQLSQAVYLLSTGEGTRLYDAINLVIKERLAAVDGAKVIVLLTDGVDTQSHFTAIPDVQAAVDASNVHVFVIQYETETGNRMQMPMGNVKSPVWVRVPDDIRNSDQRYLRADRFLYEIARASGGQLYLVDAVPGFQVVASHITKELRNEYLIGYYSQNRQGESIRKIRVAVDRSDVTVRNRTGYLTGQK